MDTYRKKQNPKSDPGRVEESEDFKREVYLSYFDKQVKLRPHPEYKDKNTPFRRAMGTFLCRCGLVPLDVKDWSRLKTLPANAAWRFQVKPK